MQASRDLMLVEGGHDLVKVTKGSPKDRTTEQSLQIITMHSLLVRRTRFGPKKVLNGVSCFFHGAHILLYGL